MEQIIANLLVSDNDKIKKVSVWQIIGLVTEAF